MSDLVFKENYAGPAFLKRVFAFMNRAGRLLNNIRGVGGCEVEANEFGGLDIRAVGTASMKLASRIVRINQASGLVEIAEGLIRHGPLSISIAGAAVACSGEVNFPTIQYVRGVSAHYMDPCPSTMLQTDGSAVYVPLARVEKIGGRLVMSLVYHVGLVGPLGEAPP